MTFFFFFFFFIFFSLPFCFLFAFLILLIRSLYTFFLFFFRDFLPFIFPLVLPLPWNLTDLTIPRPFGTIMFMAQLFASNDSQAYAIRLEMAGRTSVVKHAPAATPSNF